MKQGFYSLILLLLLAGAFWLGRRSVLPAIETVETLRIDTVYRDRLVSMASTFRPVTVNVPRLLFVQKDDTKGKISPEAAGANQDTNQDTNQVVAADSVTVEISIETRTYHDSLLTAQVSGPVVGDYRPTLDWYEVYGHTRTVTNTVTKRSRFAVTAGAGVAWTSEGIRPTVGVQVGVVLWSF